MTNDGSVTRMLHEVRNGNSSAASGLWHRYFPQLVRFARHRLQGVARLVGDEEDVALSAMNRFFVAAQRGWYPDLAGRDELWGLLLRIVDRRASNFRRDENAQRRGGHRLDGRALCGKDGDDSGISVPDGAPTPEYTVMMAEQCRKLLEQLEDAELRAIAVAKMEGYSNAEIAGQLNRSQRTVERRLRLIRDRWRLDLQDTQSP